MSQLATQTRVLSEGFTAHNIVLPDGTQTRPESPVLAQTQTCQAALRMARTICPPELPNRPRVADLGCLEGGYAVEFARAGYEVLGIEARSDSIARCNYVKQRLALERLSFAHDDVRNIKAHGTFDIVFCCGLLYHLDTPIEFLRVLGTVTAKLLILQTHYAEAEPSPIYPLTQLTQHEGVAGRWSPEAPGADWESLEQMETSAWASWENPVSFWPLRRHLLGAVQAAGFPIVCEQFDALEDVAEDPYIEQHSRSMFVGIKAPA